MTASGAPERPGLPRDAVATWPHHEFVRDGAFLERRCAPRQRHIAPWERGLVLRSVVAPVLRVYGAAFRHITTFLDSITYDFCPAAPLGARAPGYLDANTSLRDLTEPYVAELFLDARTPLA